MQARRPAILSIVAGLSLAVWISRLLGRGGCWRMRDEPAAGGDDAASVVAIVPARNEADVVAESIGSLASQVRVVLVDDASEDGTAGIARAAGADSVIAARPLPVGWTGKMWAVSEGVHAAGAPEYLLLTDADIVHPPHNVAG